MVVWWCGGCGVVDVVVWCGGCGVVDVVWCCGGGLMKWYGVVVVV